MAATVGKKQDMNKCSALVSRALKSTPLFRKGEGSSGHVSRAPKSPHFWEKGEGCSALVSRAPKSIHFWEKGEGCSALVSRALKSPPLLGKRRGGQWTCELYPKKYHIFWENGKEPLYQNSIL